MPGVAEMRGFPTGHPLVQNSPDYNHDSGPEAGLESGLHAAPVPVHADQAGRTPAEVPYGAEPIAASPALVPSVAVERVGPAFGVLRQEPEAAAVAEVDAAAVDAAAAGQNGDDPVPLHPVPDRHLPICAADPSDGDHHRRDDAHLRSRLEPASGVEPHEGNPPPWASDSVTFGSDGA